jgi:hypothetical protein
MKETIKIQCISLLVASSKPLPVFKTGSVEFSEEFPGIFSIQHVRADLYKVEVSALSILNASAVLCRLADSQPNYVANSGAFASWDEQAPSINPQPSKS